MPVVRKWAYFDHAAVAPLPEPTQAAITRFAAEAAKEGDTVWPSWSRALEELRATAAQIMAADPSEIALVPNTTTGIGIVAEGIPWERGDNVVTLAGEFPSNLYPWLNLQSRGVETRLVETDGPAVDPQRIADACDERTRIVSVSWVDYATGWRIDPAEIAAVAHDHGALFFLDAIQGLGVFPLDVGAAGVDFLAADGHKWMLGPEGAGLLYVKQEHLDRLRPTGVGWNSVAGRFDYKKIELKFRPEAARFEGGSANMVGMLGLKASLELLRDFGVGPQQSAVADRVLHITDHAVEQLQRAGATILCDRRVPNRSGIATFTPPGVSPADFRKKCLDRGIALACRGGGVRISPHAYCDEEDVRRLVEVVSSNS